LSNLSKEELDATLSGDPEELDVHLTLIERDLALDGIKAKAHCHCMVVDANGAVRPQRLAEFMRNAIVDYAIPKARVEEARQRDFKFKSTTAVSGLHAEARQIFTDLKNTGEGGELLLYLLAERFLKLPQILCKMDLKTSSKMHYHGADGVYASVTEDGILKLFWGESKIYQSIDSAMASCFNSLAPFLIDEDEEGSKRERDLMLLSSKADLGDERLSTSLKRYFDKSIPTSNRVKYCGIALVGYEVDLYLTKDNKLTHEEVVNGAKKEMEGWISSATDKVKYSKLDDFEIEILCFPIPSSQGFRDAFLKAMGFGGV
jgi:hypothetical protein